MQPKNQENMRGMIDPQQEEEYWRQNYQARPYYIADTEFEDYRPAYQYGQTMAQEHQGKPFKEVQKNAKAGWTKARGESKLSWKKAEPMVRDAYDRVIQLWEEELHVHKEEAKVGEVRLHKEVTTEQKTLEVPVAREEVMIERHQVDRPAAAADFKAEEVRVPVQKEQVHLEKEGRVREEVHVGKRKVQDTEKVSGTTRKEVLKVDNEEGQAKIHDKRTDETKAADRKQP